MRITLQIENVDRLESGGQVSYSCADRGFDIGRHEHLDWSLPDPQRVISGKHCEVRFEDGQFVLYDISTNGTFLNGSPNRMDKAHALRAGDKLMIGDYIISVALEQSDTMGAGAAVAPEAPSATPAWNAPQTAQAPEPAWPGAGAQVPDAPYPAPNAGGPWEASPGMEGRHAPPSAAPGIGTPEDSVWGQNGHGWGSADPALYDTSPQNPALEAARPAQADPMDHLAAQPHLAQPGGNPAAPPVAQPQTNAASLMPDPATAPAAETPAPAPEQPLFNMPDLGQTDPSTGPIDLPVETSEPASSGAGSPFPETAEWPAVPETEPSVASEPAAAVQDQPAMDASPGKATDGTVEEEDTSSRPDGENTVNTEKPPRQETDFIKAFAEGAGIPESVLQGRDSDEFARELGSVLQEITSDLMGLLQARSQVKAMTRNANRTLINRSGNNALKFSPTAQSALQTMLSPNAEENGYLPMEKAMSAAFKDIQKHHVWTYSAMQKAAARFDETLSPKAIEEEGKVTKSAFANQNAKLWERMQERWTSLSSAYDDGLVGVFTQYFTEGYEELSSQDEGQGPDQF